MRHRTQFIFRIIMWLPEHYFTVLSNWNRLMNRFYNSIRTNPTMFCFFFFLIGYRSIKHFSHVHVRMFVQTVMMFSNLFRISNYSAYTEPNSEQQVHYTIHNWIVFIVYLFHSTTKKMLRIFSPVQCESKPCISMIYPKLCTLYILHWLFMHSVMQSFELLWEGKQPYVNFEYVQWRELRNATATSLFCICVSNQ